MSPPRQPTKISHQPVSRSLLIEKVASKNPDLEPQAVEKVVQDIIHEMATQLINGQKVTVRQLGGWRLKTSRAKNVRNPKTGETLAIDGRETIHYKQSRYVFNVLNPHLRKTNRRKK